MSTHNIPFFNLKKRNTLNYLISVAMGFFQEIQKQVRKRRGKRAISVRAIEVLLYFEISVFEISSGERTVLFEVNGYTCMFFCHFFS